MIVMLSTNVTPVALMFPTLTLQPKMNPEPETVIDVPPDVGPEGGLTELTVGDEIEEDELDEVEVELDEEDMRNPFQGIVCDIPNADTDAKLRRELPSRPTFAQTAAVYRALMRVQEKFIIFFGRGRYSIPRSPANA